MAEFDESWKALREEIDARSRRLSSEIADAWSDVQLLPRLLAERVQAQDPADAQPTGWNPWKGYRRACETPSVSPSRFTERSDPCSASSLRSPPTRVGWTQSRSGCPRRMEE